MIIRTLALATACAIALSACVSPSTDEIGATINADGIANPAGQNSFAVTFDPSTPGIPKTAYVASGKDEDNVALTIRYAYPDGTTSEWSYAAEASKGSTQTAAITAALEAIAQQQGTTVEALAPDVIAGVQAIIEAALAVP